MSKEELETIGATAIRQLREVSLNKGLSFMINDSSLPTDQCYLEYPDGSIKLVRINYNVTDFKIIAELNVVEQRLLRQKYILD